MMMIRKITPITFLLLLMGCSRSYYVNRAQDGLDCITATVGQGVGFKAMAGPINTGFILGFDNVGVREGVVIAENGCKYIVGNFLVFPIGPVADRPEFRKAHFGMDVLPSRTAHYAAYINKYPFYADLILRPDVPILQSTMHEKNIEEDEDHKKFTDHARQYYSQLEVVGGIVFTIRIGLNPGEFLDFLLGFTGIDIYKDDLHGTKSETSVSFGAELLGHDHDARGFEDSPGSHALEQVSAKYRQSFWKQCGGYQG